MNSFYYFSSEDVRREDACLEHLNMLIKLQVYKRQFTKIEFFHIIFSKKLVWKDLGILCVFFFNMFL